MTLFGNKSRKPAWRKPLPWDSIKALFCYLVVVIVGLIEAASYLPVLLQQTGNDPRLVIALKKAPLDVLVQFGFSIIILMVFFGIGYGFVWFAKEIYHGEKLMAKQIVGLVFFTSSLFGMSYGVAIFREELRRETVEIRLEKKNQGEFKNSTEIRKSSSGTWFFALLSFLLPIMTGFVHYHAAHRKADEESGLREKWNQEWRAIQVEARDREVAEAGFAKVLGNYQNIQRQLQMKLQVLEGKRDQIEAKRTRLEQSIQDEELRQRNELKTTVENSHVQHQKIRMLLTRDQSLFVAEANHQGKPYLYKSPPSKKGIPDLTDVIYQNFGSPNSSKKDTEDV